MSRGGLRPGSGRPKGSRSPIARAREEILRLCEEADYNPLQELIVIAQSNDPRISLKLKAEVHKEILSYIAPKLKSIKVESSDDRQVIVQLVDVTGAMTGEPKIFSAR